MIKAVIFDLDNTLIDFMRFKEVSCSNAVDAMIDAGLKIPKKKALDVIYRLYEKYSMEDPKIFQHFLKKVTGRVDYRELAYAINAYRTARTAVLTPFPGTKRTLIKLKEKGMKLAIITDAPKLKAWLRLSAMKIDDFFDVVVAKEDTGRAKPSRLPFRAVLKQLDLKPEQCLMVGDMPQKDIKGARSLGIKTCYARYGSVYRKKKVKSDYEIKDITDLSRIIAKSF
ncbi:TIGR02253 family HAD-type hydrolase [Candidatus Woesearchaeota archaeon]|nr:TIGR02253 family HAD-type hydrolase [Candidatus Woesearchaeota archaeon]